MNSTRMLEQVRSEKNVGVLTDHELNFDLPNTEKIKTQSMLGVI